MNGSLHVSASVCWMLLLGNAALDAQGEDPQLRARFLEGVRQTARKLDQVSAHAKGVNTQDFAAVSKKARADLAEFNKKRRPEQRIDPDKARTRTFECAIRGSFTLEKTKRREGGDRVMAKNDAYAFAIGRSPGIASYGLEFLERLHADPATDRRIEEQETPPRGSILAAWYVQRYPLSRLVESPWFKIKRVSAVRSEGQDLVRVDFDHLVDGPDRKRDWLSDAFLVCDPARDWALKEYGGTMSEGAVRRVTIEFGELVSGFPIPSRFTFLTSSSNDPETISRNASTLEILRRDVPKEEFYLSHYALPEPNFERGWLGPWVWYLMGGIAFVVIGTILATRRKARR